MLISMINTKGGCGKSALGVQLATGLKLRGHDVLLVDADRQGSSAGAIGFRQQREDLPQVEIAQVFGGNLTRQLLAFKERYGMVVCDTPGRDAVEVGQALAADLAIVPMAPDDFTVWTLSDVNDKVGQYKGMNPNLRAILVLNKAEDQDLDTREALEFIEEYEHLEWAEIVIHKRKAIPRASAQGLNVSEYRDRHGKKHSPAIGEIDAFIDTILKWGSQ